MILYFVKAQLAFAVLLALQCALVLALAGIYVSFEQWRHPSPVKTRSPDNREEADFRLRFPRARPTTLAGPKEHTSQEEPGMVVSAQ